MFISISAHAKAGDWGGLERLSMQKAHKQLFTASAEVFVDACISVNAYDQAIKYIPKVKDRRKRLQLALQVPLT